MVKIVLLLLVLGALAALVLRARSSRSPLSPAATAQFYASDPPEALAGRAPDFAFIDDYLERWDRFAQGENALQESLGRDVRRFNAELAHALRAEPERAMGRAIFYPIVQVGSFVPLSSPVGAALADAFGGSGPPVREVKGERLYFVGDLYFWWEANRARYARYDRYEDWRGREFARTVAIPMYTAARERPGHR